MAATVAETNAEVKPTPERPSILVVDIRKRQSRKRIRNLRKGKGSLMDEVQETVEELRANNAITGTVQPVVIVVRQKSRRWRMGRLGI